MIWRIDEKIKFYNIATKIAAPDRKVPIFVISLAKTDLTVYSEADLDAGVSKKSLQANRQVLSVRSSPWSAELVSTSKFFFFFTNAAAKQVSVWPRQIFKACIMYMSQGFLEPITVQHSKIVWC